MSWAYYSYTTTDAAVPDHLRCATVMFKTSVEKTRRGPKTTKNHMWFTGATEDEVSSKIQDFWRAEKEKQDARERNRQALKKARARRSPTHPQSGEGE